MFDARDRDWMRARNRSQMPQPHERVEYRVAPAEDSGIDSGTVDLIMVAQALHWFDLDRFYAEARRVLKPDGVLAASAYNLLHIEPTIDEVVNRYYYEVVGPFGRRSAKLVENVRPISHSRFRRSIRRKFEMTASVEPRSSGRLPSNVVFDAAVHCCERRRSVEADNR